MSEGKRVSLQSIGPTKKDKKCKSTSSTIRLNLTLPTFKSDTFADFNYNSLIVNERKKKEKEKSRDKDEKGNGGGIDPYASDDDDNLRRIASSFESKYGTPKKKCRRLEDYTELGTGYDENDSFIDNTDAYDEVVPEDQAPELDGFYINKGELTFKRVDGRSSSDQSSSDESDGPQNTKSHKRPLSSGSESGSSGSSDTSDDSDESEDSEEDEEEEEPDTEIPKETKPSSKEVKEEKSNGHGNSPAAKKPKLLESSSKKVKNKAISGVFLKKAVSEKEHNEKHLKHDLCEIVPSEKRVSMTNVDKAQSEKSSNLESDIKQISSIDAAIEAVARGEDSKESGIAESKSHSGSSDETDSDESGNVNGQSNGVLRVAPQLPSNLPPSIVEVISSLIDYSSKNSNLHKTSLFTSEFNALLLKFEKFMRSVSKEKKPGIYDHLEFYLPCRREVLMKRGKALLMECVEIGYKEPLAQLKIGIDTLMPSAMERYQSMCKKYESNDSPADLTDASKPADKTKTPRRRFPWTEQLKGTFIKAVKKRRVYFATVKQKDQRWEDHLREFLKKDVLPMWETGWMKVVSLMDILSKMEPDVLQFKPQSKSMNPSDATVKNLACPSKKLGMKVEQTPNDAKVEPMKVETTIKKISSSSNNVAGNPKPQSVNHQIHNNSHQVSSYEVAAKSDVPLNSSRTASSVSLMQSSTLPSSNQTSALDLLGSEIAETLRTSLANMVSVTPVQSSSSHSSQNNLYLSSSSVQSKKSLGSGVDIINLSSNGMDASIEVVQKKRMSLPANATQSGQQNPSIVQSLNVDLQYLSKQQQLALSNASPTQTTQQSSYHSSSPHNQIKVSSVSAINLKLSGPQSQAQSHPSSSKASMSQASSSKASLPLPPSNKANMPQPSSNKASLLLPPPNKASLHPPSSNKVNMPQPPSNRVNMPQPPSNKANLPQPPSNKANISQLPSNKTSMPQPQSNKMNMPQLPSNKASMTPPQHSKANMPLPSSSKATMLPPSSTKANMAHTSSSKSSLSMPHPLTVKSSMSQSTSSKTNMSQPSSKASQSQPLRNNNHQNVSGAQGALFSPQSVISHGLEPSSLGVSSSLTITPVKPSSSNTYYQQAKASAHSTVQSSNSSIISHGNPSVRSEVIVTPSISSSMPHIKSTNANFSASSASSASSTSTTSSVSSSNIYPNPLASSNNFSTPLSSSANNFSNSRGGASTYQSSHQSSHQSPQQSPHRSPHRSPHHSPHIIGGNGYSSSLSSSDASLRTHRTMASDSSTSRIHSSDKIAYSQSSRSQAHDKPSYMSPSMWSSSGPVDVSKSPSSSPSSVKSVTPSPEKAMVSRKDRILQETRERPGNDPMMPTLSGPYRSSPSSSDANNTARNLTQPKATSQNLPWDDELFILEDFLKMSSPPPATPQSTPKVSTTSTDSYKHPLPILESQRCDNTSNKSHLDPPRPKNLTVPTTTEQQRANVVMHTPYAHNSSKSSSLGFMQHPRDQPRTIISNHAVRDLSRPSSTKSSLNQDAQRANVVMVTPHFQESLRASSLKDEMNDILAGIPTQMISRTDHYTITNSMATHNAKREMDMTINSAASMRNDPKNLGSQEESRQKVQDLAMRGILMSRTNCDGSYPEDNWAAASMKKTVSNKSANDISDQRLSGMGPISSSLSMTGLDDMGLGLPSHLLGYQNDYQRHLYGSSSKTTGPNDHRPL